MFYIMILLIILVVIFLVADSEKEACEIFGFIHKLYTPVESLVKFVAKNARDIVTEGKFPKIDTLHIPIINGNWDKSLIVIANALFQEFEFSSIVFYDEHKNSKTSTGSLFSY